MGGWDKLWSYSWMTLTFDNYRTAPLGRIYTTSKFTSTGKIVMVIHETVPYISGNQ